MNVIDAIETRRAYRSLEPVEITDEIIKELTTAAALSASCFNNQPWRYVFVREASALKKMHAALSKGNEWARNASLIIAVLSKTDYDCQLKGREYFLFDTGMSAAFLILRATELGLVAHPIAGYSEEKAGEILNIPAEMKVITLIIVGKHSDKTSPLLSEKQAEAETKRPERLPAGKIASVDSFSPDLLLTYA